MSVVRPGFTFVISPKDEDPVTRHNLKLVVFGQTGHLNGSQRDYSSGVDVLKERTRRLVVSFICRLNNKHRLNKNQDEATVTSAGFTVQNVGCAGETD